jgi:hypothetical protein
MTVGWCPSWQCTPTSEGEKLSKPLFSPEFTAFYTGQNQIKRSVEPSLLFDKKVTYLIIICLFIRVYV